MPEPTRSVAEPLWLRHWGEVKKIMEHRWGPVGIAALIGFLPGVIAATCLG